MTPAAAIASSTAGSLTRPGAGRLATVEILDDLKQAEPAWRILETGTSTAYQRFAFLDAWQRNVGMTEASRPYIVIGYDSQKRPLLLLPLALRSAYGVRIAEFMGGKHATFNMALWDEAFAASAVIGDLETLLDHLRRHGEADVVAFARQPLRWGDGPNPFSLLPHQASVNPCPALTIAPGLQPISSGMRKNLRRKERKLQTAPGYRYSIAATDQDVARMLDWFFRVKPLRMAEQNLPNVFARPGVEAFIREACRTLLPGAHRAIEIHALECDDEVIALFAGVADGRRVSMMFNTYTMSEHARYSPGLILLRNIIDHYTTAGYTSVDLGIGDDEYKRMFCKSDEPIFDSFIALNLRGTPVAQAMAAIARSKRFVKQNEALFRLARLARGALQRREATDDI